MPNKKKSSKAKQGSAKKKLSAPKRPSKTPNVKAKVAIKKSAAPKKELARARKPQITTAELVSPKVASVAAAAEIAPQKVCLPLPAAIKLVRSCSGAPDNLPLDTQLGVLFPSPVARNSFCQCVADGVPIGRSEIPCGSSNTLQDVVDAIAC